MYQVYRATVTDYADFGKVLFNRLYFSATEAELKGQEALAYEAYKNNSEYAGGYYADGLELTVVPEMVY